MSKTAVPNRLRFNLSPDEINKLTEEIISKSKAVLDKVAGIPAGKRTFDNVVAAMAEDDGEADTLAANAYFPMYTDVRKEVRDAAKAAMEKLDAFSIECGMREDVYLAVKEVQQAKPTLSAADQRLLDRTVRDFERNGLALPAEKRAKIKELKQELSKLSIQFSSNLNEETTKVPFTKAQLDGMPEDWLSRLDKDKDSDCLLVSLKYPDIIPLMKHCKVEATRRKMDLTNGAKLPENVKILEKIIQLRQEKAELMGYDTHADFVLEIKMAKNKKTVLAFLDDLTAKLDAGAKKEMQELLKLKESECKKAKVEFDGKINSWDFNYYHTLLLNTAYQVDVEAISKYFPLDKCTKGMLEIYQEILGLRFAKDTKGEVWHADVEKFEVYDAATEHFVGHFYLDLFPRDGKYGHAAAFNFHRGYTKLDGSRQYPAAAMVANFTKPSADQPSLLKHNEFVTYFHEFGHVMHDLCTRVKWSRFAGTSVERDFVEAPSQMLENWCWQPEILRRVAGHYKTGEPLPAEMLDKLVAAKNVNAGLLNRRQLFFGHFDMRCHTSKSQPVNTEKLWRELRKAVTLIEQPDGTNPSAAFGHIAGGYDAGYYGYLYSQVFSADMFDRFKREGVMNKTAGAAYRNEILAPGGERDSMDGLIAFLGREPKNEPFLKSIGL